MKETEQISAFSGVEGKVKAEKDKKAEFLLF